MVNSRKVAVYARVSTEHEAQIAALDNQIQYYDEILQRHEDWELYDRYIDEGITGTSVNKRPNFLRMIKDAKEGKFDLIVTREVSRFARNTVDTLQETRKLKKMGVEVYFTEDNIWTMNDEDGELRLTLMATLAQNESKKTSLRVKAGQKVSFENGVPYGNGNILGYDRVDREYIINEEQAETVKRIFDLYVAGNGVKKIQWTLEQEKRLTATGKQIWQPGTISRILRNPFYCGTVVYRKQVVLDFLEQKKINNFGEVEKIVVEGKHTPIISKEQFDIVQKMLDSKTISTEYRGKHAFNPSKDIWARKVKCQCGKNVSRVVWHGPRDNPKQSAYQCYGQVRTGTVKTRLRKGLPIDGICTTTMVPKWKLEAMADMIFQLLWKDKDNVVKIAKEMLDKRYLDNAVLSADNIRRQELKNKLAAFERKYDNLIEMRMNGEINRERFEGKQTEVEEDIRKLKEELSELGEDENSEATDFRRKLELLESGLPRDLEFSTKNIPEYILDNFVKEVIITDKGFIWRMNLTGGFNIAEANVSGRGKASLVTVPNVYYSDASMQHRLLLLKCSASFVKRRDPLAGGFLMTH